MTPYNKRVNNRGHLITKSQQQLQTIIHDLERQGLKPTVTKLKTKRSHKLQLRGRRSTL